VDAFSFTRQTIAFLGVLAVIEMAIFLLFPTAIVALARKLAGILFAIWRNGSVYDGSRGAKML